MARAKRSKVSKTLHYFFLNDKLHKAIRSSRSRDEVIAWCYPDKKRMLYSYSQVVKNMGKAFTISEVSVILNKHRVTIQDYILEGKIKKPQFIYPIGNPDSKWFKYMFSESDILDLHQHIIDSGHSKEIPSKNELSALLKHNMILYTKTTDGRFVPVWKAE